MSDFWTDERIEQLKAYWADPKLSARIIGRRMGCTRCAVIGKAHRLNLPLRKRGRPLPPEPPAAMARAG